jgi:hypothetical protein
MAEKIAVEQAILRVPKLRGMTWNIPILLGILFAVLFLSGCNPTTKSCSGGNVSTTIDFSWMTGIGVLTGFGFGFGVGCFGQASWRSTVLTRIRQQTRTLHQKLGAQRTISWNTESLTVSSAMIQAQINWRLIDKLENGKIGIHGLSGGQVIFGFPKEALPQNLTTDELIKVWQSYFSKPPKLA